MNFTSSTMNTAKQPRTVLRRSMLLQHWGVLFAILAFLVTTLLSLKHLPAKPSTDSSQPIQQHDANTSSHDELLTTVAAIEKSSESQSENQEQSDSASEETEASRLTFEEIDFNRGWRKAKSGWVRIQQYRVEPMVQLNFVQRISPVFWGLCLWMFAIILLVFAS